MSGAVTTLGFLCPATLPALALALAKASSTAEDILAWRSLQKSAKWLHTVADCSSKMRSFAGSHSSRSVHGYWGLRHGYKGPFTVLSRSFHGQFTVPCLANPAQHHAIPSTLSEAAWLGLRNLIDFLGQQTQEKLAKISAQIAFRDTAVCCTSRNWRRYCLARGLKDLSATRAFRKSLKGLRSAPSQKSGGCGFSCQQFCQQAGKH